MLQRDAIKGLLEETIALPISKTLINNWAPLSLWCEACRVVVVESSYRVFLEGNRLLDGLFKVCLTKHPCYGAILQVFTADPFVVNKTGIFLTTIGRTTYLYITEQKGSHAPASPVPDSVFHAQVNDTTKKFERILRRFQRSYDHSTEEHTEPPVPSRNIRRRLNNETEEEEPPPQQEEEEDARAGGAGGVTVENVVVDPFWESSEARKLFGAQPTDLNARITLERKIELLKLCNHHKKTGYKLILDGGDAKDECTTADIIHLTERSLILLLSYKACLRQMGMNGASSFATCIQEVLHYMEDTGIDQATHFQTVQEWNRIFRHRELWPHPRGPPGARNRSDPPLFEVYPEAKRNIVQWCRDNIRDMSCEKLHDYILTHLVPDDLLPKWIESLSDQDSQQVLAATAEEQKCMFLQAHRLSKLSLSTVLRWMGRIGMKYQTKSKSFYVDGHEREVVVRSRTTFVNKYLREWETRCLRFVRLSEEQLAGIPNLSASDCLCSYANDGTILFYEVHEDRLHKLGNDNDIQLQCDDMPRQQSIRATPNQKPLIIVGQDECIFHQYLLNLKGWVGPNGERCLDPKTIGEGLMISAFKSRDLGFGHRPFTQEEVVKINQHREGKVYIDSEAAKEVLGSDQKEDNPLKFGNMPFIRYLLIGKCNEGYWSSAHMAVQLENVVDCCVALYGDVFDFLFLFDHSCGHDRKPTGALDAKSLNVGYGGSQPFQNPSLIVRVQGFLGQNPRLVDPGDIQHFNFREGDAGPYNMTEAQQEERKYDTPTGRLLNKTKTKRDLATELVTAGLVDVQNVPTTLAELQDKAREHNINLEVTVPLMVEGWMGKPKGLNQIAWERGLLDPTRTYTKAQLVKLLHGCTDFLNTETNLQMIARALGVQAERSPKFHCEIAGEGIEYDWGFCKAKYRCRPLTDKKGRASFIELVKLVTSWFFVTMNQSRRSSARARSYISAYYNIHYNHGSLLQGNEGGLPNAVEEAPQIPVAHAAGEEAAPEPWIPVPGEVLSMDMIEKAKKVYHSHRGVNSFEKGMHAMGNGMGQT